MIARSKVKVLDWIIGREYDMQCEIEGRSSAQLELVCGQFRRFKLMEAGKISWVLSSLGTAQASRVLA